MRTNTVDVLLDERARMVSRLAAVNGHLWGAEFLLARIGKLLPHMIADSPHNAVARDVVLQEIAEFLAEDRSHPGPQDLLDEVRGEATSSSSTPDDAA